MAVGGAAVVLFRLFHLPSVLGYLLGGMLIGPYSVITPAVENEGLIQALAELGLIILLFSLGLDLGWSKLRSVGLRVVVIGALEISLMITLGYELGNLLGWSGTDSIFLGAALSISSTAILYKMLSDSGQLGSVRGRIIVGILVIEDLAAVVMLTVLSGGRDQRRRGGEDRVVAGAEHGAVRRGRPGHRNAVGPHCRALYLQVQLQGDCTAGQSGHVLRLGAAGPMDGTLGGGGRIHHRRGPRRHRAVGGPGEHSVAHQGLLRGSVLRVHRDAGELRRRGRIHRAGAHSLRAVPGGPKWWPTR